ncbi:MAG: flagellar assembly protein FliW [Spirochaetota bacterium]|nr:flagellar assembly protein FliW [Spirochaetota bacterium]
MGIQINTKPYGEIEVSEKQIIDFPDGILGFEFINRFVILDSIDNSPFKWLQAFTEPDLAFVIIMPDDFLNSYNLVISEIDLQPMGTDNIDELLIFAIVTIPTDPKEMTANLQGPILINPKNSIGRQAISLSDKYHSKHKILDEMKKALREKE